jgi:membrane-bound metal-dependent hydrolase YbcI (DUF457 family)
MPLTPFHIGPGLFIPLLLFNIINLPTFLIASVVVDVEPILVLSLSLQYPLHGFLHSFVGGSIVALALTIVMVKSRKLFSPLMSSFKLEQKWSIASISIASFSGIYLHLFLDAQMHYDMQPFFPLAGNPFLDQSSLSGLIPVIFCVWCFFGAVLMYSIRLVSYARKPQKKPQKSLVQQSLAVNGSRVQAEKLGHLCTKGRKS